MYAGIWSWITACWTRLATWSWPTSACAKTACSTTPPRRPSAARQTTSRLRCSSDRRSPSNMRQNGPYSFRRTIRAHLNDEWASLADHHVQAVQQVSGLVGLRHPHLRDAHRTGIFAHSPPYIHVCWLSSAVAGSVLCFVNRTDSKLRTGAFRRRGRGRAFPQHQREDRVVPAQHVARGRVHLQSGIVSICMQSSCRTQVVSLKRDESFKSTCVGPCSCS